MNWLLILLFGTGIIAFIIFLAVRNQKDEKVFEEELKNDFHKTKNDAADAATDTAEEAVK